VALRGRIFIVKLKSSMPTNVMGRKSNEPKQLDLDCYNLQN